MSRPTDRRGGWRPEYARGMTIAFEFAGTVLLFWLAGRGIDGWLGTTPWAQIVGSLIGWGGGFAHVYYKAQKMEQAEQARQRASKESASKERAPK